MQASGKQVQKCVCLFLVEISSQKLSSPAEKRQRGREDFVKHTANKGTNHLTGKPVPQRGEKKRKKTLL